MSKNLINFFEKETTSPHEAWNMVSTEEFLNNTQAYIRFKQAVELSHDSAHPVKINLWVNGKKAATFQKFLPY